MKFPIYVIGISVVICFMGGYFYLTERGVLASRSNAFENMQDAISKQRFEDALASGDRFFAIRPRRPSIPLSEDALVSYHKSLQGWIAAHAVDLKKPLVDQYFDKLEDYRSEVAALIAKGRE